MKTRTGFVSNSSSCSFIVDFPNVEDTLIYMLDNYLEELKNEPEEYWLGRKAKISAYRKGRIKEVKKMIHNFKVLSERKGTKDCPIAFHSCNFDSYLRKINLNGKEYIYVSTCNNTQWELHNAEGLFPIRYEIEKMEIGNMIGFSSYDIIPAIEAGDVWDGYFDDIYIKGNEFYLIDDDKLPKIRVKTTHCQWINDDTEVVKE